MSCISDSISGSYMSLIHVHGIRRAGSGQRDTRSHVPCTLLVRMRPTYVHARNPRVGVQRARARGMRGVGGPSGRGSTTVRRVARAAGDGGAVERGAVERGAGEHGAGARGAVERRAGERGAGEHDADEVGGDVEPRRRLTPAPAERGAERAWEACAGHASGTGGRCGRTPRTMETTATTTVAAVEATETQPAAPGTAQVSCCQAREIQRLAGSLVRHQAGRRGRARIHLRIPAARSRW